MNFTELETMLHKAGTTTARIWWVTQDDNVAQGTGDGTFEKPCRSYEIGPLKGDYWIVYKEHDPPLILTNGYLQIIATTPADYQRRCLEALVAHPPQEIQP